MESLSDASVLMGFASLQQIPHFFSLSPEHNHTHKSSFESLQLLFDSCFIDCQTWQFHAFLKWKMFSPTSRSKAKISTIFRAAKADQTLNTSPMLLQCYLFLRGMIFSRLLKWSHLNEATQEGLSCAKPQYSLEKELKTTRLWHWNVVRRLLCRIAGCNTSWNLVRVTPNGTFSFISTNGWSLAVTSHPKGFSFNAWHWLISTIQEGPA